MRDIELLGSPGSPYTRKMLALLRYRRIAYRVLWGSFFEPPAGYPIPKVKLLPTFYFPTAQGLDAVVDSTPIIQRLEAEHPGRSVVPDDEVLRFLDRLIEDFADEWVTKAMFHYRWHHAEDAAHAAPLLAFWQGPHLSDEKAAQVGGAFAQRQISRLPVVGSSDLTAPVIESSYQRLIGIMDRLIARRGFLFGSRPAAADFALYGQLTQLGLVDPTPARWLERHSPRLRAWLDQAEDLSGHTGQQWMPREAVHAQLGEMLREIGRVYAPFLVANAQAAARGAAEFEAVLDGQRWTQAVFPYQVKCLETLRHARLAMDPAARGALDEVLAGTGVGLMFEG